MFKVITASVRGSPFVGVYCLATDTYCLIPNHIESKVETEIQETLNVKTIRTTILESNLIGSLCCGNSTKLAVPVELEKKELSLLEKELPNVEILKLKGNFALGNLVALNDSKMILSEMLPEKIKNDIINFFGLDAKEMSIQGNPLMGSLIKLTNKGFLVGTLINKAEFAELKEFTGLNGMVGTCNYGDRFIGNDLIANSNGLAAGFITSGFELGRIDEALSGR